MRTCDDCGKPNDRGWSVGGNPERCYCLVCETARLFDRPRQPVKYQRNRERDQECQRRLRNRRKLEALRGTR